MYSNASVKSSYPIAYVKQKKEKKNQLEWK